MKIPTWSHTTVFGYPEHGLLFMLKECSPLQIMIRLLVLSLHHEDLHAIAYPHKGYLGCL